ncbi:MAG: flavodoxin domain-containing protein [Anaerolineae bacterium]|nr:flavodoxin domain-containing protein [Anaerolineae bacterium]
MSQRILVAFASKYGATAEIAARIGQVLREVGLHVDVQPAETVSDLSPYTAVILGSAVYAGSWRKEAVHFLETFEDKLAQMPVWLFSSGPTGQGDPLTLLKGWNFPDAQKPLTDHIQPRDLVLFHGEINMQKLNFGEKLIIKGLKAPVGDFRDWKAISAWTMSVADVLKHGATQMPQ